jgi:hypothetical protein
MSKKSKFEEEGKSSQWYSEETVKSLLEHYIGGDHINITDALNSTDQLSHHLQLFLNQEDPDSLQTPKQIAFIPLNVSALTGEPGINTNHWVGLYVFTDGSDNLVTVAYIDPMGHAINNQIQHLIEQQLGQSFTSVKIEQPLLGNGIQYVSQVSEIELFGNLDDCGPMLIYAATCLSHSVTPIKINGKIASDTLGNFLRKSFADKDPFNKIEHALNEISLTATLKAAELTIQQESSILIDHKRISKEIQLDFDCYIKNDVLSENKQRSCSSQSNSRNSSQSSSQTSPLKRKAEDDSILPQAKRPKVDFNELENIQKVRIVTKKQKVSSQNSQTSQEELIMEIQKSHIKAIELFQQKEFDEAEREIVKVLKPMLDISKLKTLKTEQIEYVKAELLDSIYHLGLIYLESDKYPENYAKTATIFQYCANFAMHYKTSLKLADGVIGDQEYFIKQAYLVEEKFLANIRMDVDEISEKNLLKSGEELATYKDELRQVRSDIKDKLNQIQNLTIDEISDRADMIEEICRDCNSFFVNHEQNQAPGFIQRLLADCHKQLGFVPYGCEYALVGLGSLSLGTMTPWSDLEFAILVNDEKYKDYFRDFTKLLHIKIINLGETILPIVGVEALNNVKTGNESDEWFWDGLTQRGFSLDGKRWYACKSPLGRQGGYKTLKKIIKDDGEEQIIIEELPDYELILTPDEMAEFQKEAETGKCRFETDRHLVQALKSVSLIEGSQKLLDIYRQKIARIVSLETVHYRALELLQEDLNKFSLKFNVNEGGKMFSAKEFIASATGLSPH